MILFSEGSLRHANEDAVRVKRMAGYSSSWIGAIADGQGGRPGGARAAQVACDSALRAISALFPENLQDQVKWSELFQTVDIIVSRDAEAGYSTLIMFCVWAGNVYGAACGDSAAYLCQSGGQAIELTADQKKNPQIGSGAARHTFFASPLTTPWRLIFMTDGVWKYVGSSKIDHLLRTARTDELASQLESAGRLSDGGHFPDDFTFVLLEG